ncbi:DUF2637 domain-containing protein [Nocardia transvalensis]|nr:DUF2637 domain-containing protein [Nocardia transvalensis]
MAYKSFEMSYAALHDLAVRNLVAPQLAANVPIVTDGLMVGSIIATASFRKGGLGWWYATGLFVLSTLLSVAGNIEYAREIGGDIVSVSIYAGMPMTMMFAVHLTLMLWNRRQDRKPRTVAQELPEPVRAHETAQNHESAETCETTRHLDTEPIHAFGEPDSDDLPVPDMFDMSDLPTEPERKPFLGPFIAAPLTEPRRYPPAATVDNRSLVHTSAPL